MGKEKLILAEPLVTKVFGDEKVTVLERCKGRDLSGLRYVPIFDFVKPEKPDGSFGS